MRFTKMHGQGNDFVVLNGVTEAITLSGVQIQFLADRHLGVGCDQVLLVEASDEPEVDFRYRIFNADGGEVEQCGNGARCFAVFVRDQGLTQKTKIRVRTMSGVITPEVHADGSVTVDMGPPIFSPAQIPMTAPSEALRYTLEIDQERLEIGALSMGNPHAVQLVDDVDLAEVARLGPLLEQHPNFPARVNAGFMQVLARDHIKLRVFERGAGETLACGTGACAAVVTGIRWGLLDPSVTVSTRGGDLSVTWQADVDGGSVKMSGAATTVFEGSIALPADLVHARDAMSRANAPQI